MSKSETGNIRQIFTAGECILDIVFKNNEFISALPGGSKLNTAVSLGRLHLPVSLISECCDDTVGQFILKFLEKSRVDTGLMARYEGQVRLAFAFLDQHNNASYTFYPGSSTASVVYPEPVFGPRDILLYGSFYAFKAENRPRVRHLVRRADEAGCILIYDPNFRKAHLNDLEQLMPAVLENIQMADIIRGSDEDFGNIFQCEEPKRIYQQVRSAGCRILILTRGSKDVFLFTEKLEKSYTVPSVPTVSTIGAGDNFNAGILYELFRQGIMRNELAGLPGERWDAIMETAIAFATHVCTQPESYVSWPFAESYKAGNRQSAINR